MRRPMGIACAWFAKAIGDDAELFVDANGGYTRKQALAMAERFARRKQRDLV